MLGERRLHLHNFVLFLLVCVGIAAGLVAVFVATIRAEPEGQAPADTAGS